MTHPLIWHSRAPQQALARLQGAPLMRPVDLICKHTLCRSYSRGSSEGECACSCTSESESVLRWRLKKDWLPSKLCRRLFVFVTLPLWIK